MNQDDKELVDPLDRSAAGILLMNAMAASAPDDLFSQRFIDPCIRDGVRHPILVEVVLTVNGHRVPFLETVNEQWQHLEAGMDKAIREKALELLGKAGLESIMRKFEENEHEFQDLLERVQKENREKRGY